MMNERAFPFIRMNEREGKPRTRGITEIRGPYYTPMGKRYLEDVLETMGEYVDSLKFAGGSFTLMPEKQLKEIIDLAHRYNVLVSTGGFIEHVLTQGSEAVNRYIEECHNVGFDILEISSGLITIPVDDWLRLVAPGCAWLRRCRVRGLRLNLKLVSSLVREEPVLPKSLSQKALGMWIGQLDKPEDFWMPVPT
jgi:hypothetical protein